MNKSNTDKLYKDYPKIFKQKDDNVQTSCMPFGFECGNGWYWLIDRLCELLQFNIDKNGYPQIEATQVKEKFGGLRFCTDINYNESAAMIEFAEHLSYSICEVCGSTDDVSQTSGWIMSLCKNCKR